MNSRGSCSVTLWMRDSMSVQHVRPQLLVCQITCSSVAYTTCSPAGNSSVLLACSSLPTSTVYVALPCEPPAAATSSSCRHDVWWFLRLPGEYIGQEKVEQMAQLAAQVWHMRQTKACMAFDLPSRLPYLKPETVAAAVAAAAANEAAHS